jgi:hypothetical protein
MLLPFDICYCHLVYIIAIWYMLLPFVICYCHSVYVFCCRLSYSSNFGILPKGKSVNPDWEESRKTFRLQIISHEKSPGGVVCMSLVISVSALRSRDRGFESSPGRMV